MVFGADKCWEAYKAITGHNYGTEVEIPTPFSLSGSHNSTLPISIGWFVCSKEAVESLVRARDAIKPLITPMSGVPINYRNFVAKQYVDDINILQDKGFFNRSFEEAYEKKRIGAFHLMSTGRIVAKVYELLEFLENNKRAIR